MEAAPRGGGRVDCHPANPALEAGGAVFLPCSDGARTDTVGEEFGANWSRSAHGRGALLAVAGSTTGGRREHYWR